MWSGAIWNARGRCRQKRGFTLVELLIVVAILGIIGGMLIPMMLDGLHRSKQKRTMADIRNTGQCWMSWLTDQASAAAAGTPVRTYDFTGDLGSTLTAAELLSTLYVNQTFFYCSDVIERDAWGYDLEYRWSGDPLAAQVVGIRSRGQDGLFDQDQYPIGPFTTTNYTIDIVWADGFFVSYPAGSVN